MSNRCRAGTTTAIVAGAVLLATTPAAGAGNGIPNGDFETDPVGTTPVTGWTVHDDLVDLGVTHLGGCASRDTSDYTNLRNWAANAEPVLDLPIPVGAGDELLAPGTLDPVWLDGSGAVVAPGAPGARQVFYGTFVDPWVAPSRTSTSTRGPSSSPSRTSVPSPTTGTSAPASPRTSSRPTRPCPTRRSAPTTCRRPATPPTGTTAASDRRPSRRPRSTPHPRRTPRWPPGRRRCSSAARCSAVPPRQPVTSHTDRPWSATPSPRPAPARSSWTGRPPAPRTTTTSWATCWTWSPASRPRSWTPPAGAARGGRAAPRCRPRARYRVVFVAGTYDASWAQAAGALLYVDDVRVLPSTSGVAGEVTAGGGGAHGGDDGGDDSGDDGGDDGDREPTTRDDGGASVRGGAPAAAAGRNGGGQVDGSPPAEDTGPSALATTGVDVPSWIGLGIGLVAAGGLVAAAARRRVRRG